MPGRPRQAIVPECCLKRQVRAQAGSCTGTLPPQAGQGQMGNGADMLPEQAGHEGTGMYVLAI